MIQERPGRVSARRSFSIEPVSWQEMDGRKVRATVEMLFRRVPLADYCRAYAANFRFQSAFHWNFGCCGPCNVCSGVGWSRRVPGPGGALPSAQNPAKMCVQQGKLH